MILPTTFPSEPGTSALPPHWVPVHMSSWERVKDALHDDWMMSRTEPGDEWTSLPHEGSADPKPLDRDADWRMEDGGSTEQAMRYGFAARVHFGEHGAWGEKIESMLQRDWRREWGASWEQARNDVYRGWMSGGENQRA